MEAKITNQIIVTDAGSQAVKVMETRTIPNAKVTQYQNWVTLQGNDTFTRTFSSGDAPKEVLIRSIGINPPVPIRVGFPAQIVLNEGEQNEQTVDYTSWSHWGTSFTFGGLQTTANINTFIVAKSASHPTAQIEVLFLS